jgi:hypothetical protein
MDRESAMTAVLQPPHYAEFAALLPALKRDALAEVGMGQSQKRLTSTGLSLVYSIGPCEGGHYHHASVAFGPYTPHAVGANYLLFTAALGVPWKVVGFGVTASSIHHAHVRTCSLAAFAADPVTTLPLHQFLAEAHAAPITWDQLAPTGGTS